MNGKNEWNIMLKVEIIDRNFCNCQIILKKSYDNLGLQVISDPIGESMAAGLGGNILGRK